MTSDKFRTAQDKFRKYRQISTPGHVSKNLLKLRNDEHGEYRQNTHGEDQNGRRIKCGCYNLGLDFLASLPEIGQPRQGVFEHPGSFARYDHINVKPAKNFRMPSQAFRKHRSSFYCFDDL